VRYLKTKQMNKTKKKLG